MCQGAAAGCGGAQRAWRDAAGCELGPAAGMAGCAGAAGAARRGREEGERVGPDRVSEATCRCKNGSRGAPDT